MRSALRRALGIADEIDSFRFRGSSDNPDALYYSIVHLREIGIRWRVSAQSLNHPWFQNALGQLPLDVDPNDFNAGYELYAELRGLADWLRDAVEEWGDNPSSWPSSPQFVNPGSDGPDEKPLHTKERESLLKLVIGMATAYHGYDPSADRSEIPGQIVSELDRVGLSIDIGTVRKFLKQGLELLPKATNEEDR